MARLAPTTREERRLEKFEALVLRRKSRRDVAGHAAQGCFSSFTLILIGPACATSVCFKQLGSHSQVTQASIQKSPNEQNATHQTGLSPVASQPLCLSSGFFVGFSEANEGLFG